MPNAAAEAAVLPQDAGALVTPYAPQRGSQYAQLSRRIRAAGLLDLWVPTTTSGLVRTV
jgi:hypothetical protein